MALTSPGVEVTIVDQSQYLPAPTNSVPLFIVATAQNKTDATSTAVAAATTKANANKLFQVTSQRDLVTLYGNPFFYNDTNGTPINGYELNEYGLLAAYSALGISNRAYVLRADINMSELVGRATRPTGTVADGSYWLNTVSTTWGIYQFNNASGKFVNRIPLVVTTAQMSGGVPIPSLGNIGDYAVLPSPITVAPSLDAGKQFFYKTTDNVWVPLGSPAWRRDIPTVVARNSNPTLSGGGVFNLNVGGLYSTNITINAAPANTVTDVANAINGLGWAGITAAVRDGKLCIFHSDNATQFITLSQDPDLGGSGDPLGELGLTAGTYYQPGFTYGSAAQMPLWTNQQAAPRPSGSVWMKVGAAGTGYNPVLNKYSAALANWRSQTVNIGTSDWAMTSALDSTGGAAIPAGTVYAQYNYDNEYNEGPVYLYSRNAVGPTIVTGYRTNFTTSATPSKLRVQVSLPNSPTLSQEYIVNVAGSLDPVGFVTAWAAAGIPHTTATVTINGAVQLTHVLGGEIVLNDYYWSGNLYSSSGLLASIGLVAGVTVGAKLGPSAAPRFYFTVTSTRFSGSYVVVDDASALSAGDLIGFNNEIGTLNSSTEYVILSIDNTTTPPTRFTVAEAATPTVLVSMVDAVGTVYGSKLVQTATTSASGVDAKFLVTNNYGDYKLIGDGVAYGGPGTAGGSTYSIGDLITIDGSQLGGASSTNDLTLKVTANSVASFSGAMGAGWEARFFQDVTTASATTATFATFQGGIQSVGGILTLVVDSVASGSIVAGVAGTYIQNADGLANPVGAAPLQPLTSVTALNAAATVNITSITDNTTSFTVAATGPWVVGMQVTIDLTGTFYDGTWIVASVTGTTGFTVTIPTAGAGNLGAGGTVLGLGTGGVGFYQISGATGTVGSQSVKQYRSVLTVTKSAEVTTGYGGLGLLVNQVLYPLTGGALSGFTTYGTDTIISQFAASTGGLGTYYLDKPQTFGSGQVGLDDGATVTAVQYMFVPAAPAYGHILVAAPTVTIYDADGPAPATGNGTGLPISVAGGVIFVEGTFGGAGVYGVTLAAAAVPVTPLTDYTMPSNELTSFAMTNGMIEAGQALSGGVTVLAPTGIGGVFPAIGAATDVTKNLFTVDIVGTTMTVTGGPIPPYTAGQLIVGQTISGPGIAAGTTIVAMNDGVNGTYPNIGLNGLSGVGTVGTYQLSTSHNLTGVTIFSSGTGTGGTGTYSVAGSQWAQPGTPIFSNAGAIGAVTIVSGNAVETQYKTQISNWYPITWTASAIAPTASPAAGTMWYHFAVNEVDIMVQKNGEWIGYRNTGYDFNGHPSTAPAGATDPAGPIIAASAPTTQSDGLTPLAWGDLWVDTSDLENYPRLYRWQSVNGTDAWVAIDNTDQTSSNGIVFADARWAQNGLINPITDPVPSIVSMLSSNYVDLDAPIPALYPQGTLLWNTRRSGYVVKEYRKNYFTASAYANAGAYSSSAALTPLTYGRGNLPAYEGTWVTVSGNRTNGSPYMGRKAQRAMVVKAMIAVVATNTAIRDEDNDFNLIAAPGYPELQPAMITLNNDRGNTGFIVGDTPLRLSDDATDLTNWATNAAGASSTGEDGLVTRDTYLGIFYPSGMTTDLSGNQVVVPASHAMVRTFLKNDSIGYPWFAAAGTRRGVIDNLSSIGYIDAASGEFQSIKTRVGIRDVLYVNQINPLAFFTGVGLLSYGNKSSFNSQSALDRINVVRLVAYIRRALTLAARPFIFEPNDELTRQQILAVVQSLFADLVAKRGVYDYLVVCDTSNNTPARIDRNELWVDVAIEPVKAVEFIYIPVRILNTGELGNK